LHLLGQRGNVQLDALVVTLGQASRRVLGDVQVVDEAEGQRPVDAAQRRTPRR